MKNLEELQQVIRYQFQNVGLLRTALTHTSYVNEHREKDPLATSYERLEFLGDAVLQQTVSVELYHTFTDSTEGYLTEFRQHLVCEDTLARVANKIGLGNYLYLGRGEQGDRERPALLADALEALFGAVYLDSCDRSPTTAPGLIMRLLCEEFETCRIILGGDYKTRLQQLVLSDGEDVLTYEIVAEGGLPHEREYEVVARLNSNVVGTGKGKSKREAEQNAARDALSLFGIEE